MPAKATKAPPDLKRGSRGRRFWDAVTREYTLRHDETELLAEACRLLDLADELRAAVEREGLTAIGSKGQTVAHPLLATLGSARAELRLVLRQLGLPDPATGETDASRRGRAAAEARWQRRSA